MAHGEQISANVARAAKGGRARATVLTPEQRSESARKAVNARWAKERTGVLTTIASVSSFDAGKAPTKVVAVTLSPTQPLIATPGVTTWTASSRFFATTPHEKESYTH